MVRHARAYREQHIRPCCPGSADEQYRTAAMAVRQPAPNRGKNKLHCRKRGDDDADDYSMGAEMAAITRHLRHHNAEADKVNKNRKENDQNGRVSHEFAGQTAPTIPT